MKAEAAKALRELGRFLALEPGSGYRAMAYERAASSLAAIDEQTFAEAVATQMLTELPGIGEGIAARISELAHTGEIQALTKYRRALGYEAAEIAALSGLSKKKLEVLREHVGLDSRDALLEAAKAGRVRKLPGFGAKTEERLIARLLDEPRESGLFRRDQADALWDELRAATTGPLPGEPDPEVLQLEDVRGAVHCHTTFSDGVASLEEMVRGAEALGLDYITITDHSPTAHYAHGLELDRLHQQWDEIARVQELTKVRILKGCEADILKDGGIDYPDAVLEQLDVIIASIHNRYHLDARAMTERVVRAMQHPCFKIWGHPLGRLITSREPIVGDVEAMLDAVAANRAAIEINGDPHRLDLPPEWIDAARKRGIRFVLSADAHSVNGLRAYHYAVAMARRAGLHKEDVLNTSDARSFAAAVRPAS